MPTQTQLAIVTLDNIDVNSPLGFQQFEQDGRRLAVFSGVGNTRTLVVLPESEATHRNLLGDMGEFEQLSVHPQGKYAAGMLKANFRWYWFAITQ